MDRLQKSFSLTIRFSEIDAMRVVWHGAYAKYFEDAREVFGQEYNLGYQLIESYGYYAPIVDLSIQYKRPLRYGMKPQMTISYCPVEAAKIVFEYDIVDADSNDLIARGRSVQVFTDLSHQLILQNPPFYEAWKKRFL